MKNPLTPAGIEPVAFRIVAQHLNHCATAVPLQLHGDESWSILNTKPVRRWKDHFAARTFLEARSVTLKNKWESINFSSSKPTFNAPVVQHTLYYVLLRVSAHASAIYRECHIYCSDFRHNSCL